MSKKNTENNELSMDELKDVAGGGMGLDRLGTQKAKDKKVSKGTPSIDIEENTLGIWEERAVIDGDLNDSPTSLCT